LIHSHRVCVDNQVPMEEQANFNNQIDPNHDENQQVSQFS
jgi:hypothetical protein